MVAKHLTTHLEELLEEFKDRWSEEDLELAKRVATRVADLTIRALAGDEVDAELDHAKAQLDAIESAGEESAGQVLYDAATNFVSDVLSRLLP